MWRAFFFAVGTMLVILGVECLLIESATLTADETQQPVQESTNWFQNPQAAQAPSGRVVVPKEWIPWSALASGAVVLLYSFTLPRRWGGSAAPAG